MLLMVGLAVWLGLSRRKKSYTEKNRVLIVAAILIDCIEIFKIVMLCVRNPEDVAGTILRNLPLFMCSIQLISIPLAAFAKGKLKAAALDFVLLFGILGAVFGTIGAAQNYGAYPVLSMDNVFSGVTHCISGFASLYIAISGMSSLKKQNIPITFGIITGFCVLALIADYTIPYNYMFLRSHDGTPYSIFFNLFGTEAAFYQKFIYPFVVLLLFYLYIAAFYGVFFLIQNLRGKKKTQ